MRECMTLIERSIKIRIETTFKLTLYTNLHTLIERSIKIRIETDINNKVK